MRSNNGMYCFLIVYGLGDCFCKYMHIFTPKTFLLEQFRVHISNDTRVGLGYVLEWIDHKKFERRTQK